MKPAVRREWKTGTSVVRCSESQRGAEAVLAGLGHGAKQALAFVFHLLAAIRHEEAGIDRLRNRKPELYLAAGSDRSAKFGELEPRTTVIRREASRNSRLANIGIAIGGAEIVDEAPELPLQLRPFAASQKIRLIEPDKAAKSSALPHRCTEVDVARSLFLDVEDDVDVALVATGTRLRRGHRRLEEVEISDVLVAADQVVAVEDLTRGKYDLLTNARLMGVVVPGDLDSVDDGR